MSKLFLLKLSNLFYTANCIKSPTSPYVTSFPKYEQLTSAISCDKKLPLR